MGQDMSSVVGVTTPCTNTCHNTSSHGCRQSLNDVSRNSAPNVQQNLFQLLSICWGRYALSQLWDSCLENMMAKAIRCCWDNPEQVWLYEVVHCPATPRLLTQEWHYNSSQHIIPVFLTSQISMDDDTPCCLLTTNTAPYHDATSTKRVNILDAVQHQLLSPMSINTNSFLNMLKRLSPVNSTLSQSRHCHRRTVRAHCTLHWRCRRVKAIPRKGWKALIPALRSRRKTVRLLMGCPSAVAITNRFRRCPDVAVFIFLILDGLVPGLSVDNSLRSCWWRLDCSWGFLQAAVERPPYRQYR